MTVIKNKVVSIEYTLKDDSGSVLDSSGKHGPLSYIHGTDSIIPGLEKELEGKATGAELSVTVPPEEAYGAYDEEAVFSVPKSEFGDTEELAPGVQFHAETDEGIQMFTVKDIQADHVIVDANHPLAGKTLHFDVRIVDIRDATEEELSHGHAHCGGDGCDCGSCDD